MFGGCSGFAVNLAPALPIYQSASPPGYRAEIFAFRPPPMKLEQFQWTPHRGWDRDPRSSAVGATAQLVLLFGSAARLAAEGGVAKIRAIFPCAHVFGCSTGGEIHGTQVSDDTLALTVVAFDHTRVATARIKIDGVDGSLAAGEALVRQLDPRGLRHVLVLSEGLRVNSSDLVRGVTSAVPAGVSVAGGFAADGNRLQTTHVWCDAEPECAAAVALGLYGDRLRVGVSVTGGWGPFGPDRVITRSSRNVLYEFDGRPALALYKQYLGEFAAGLPATGLMFPIELRVGESGHRVLRALLGVNEAEQSITFAGDVPEGASARFTVGHIEDLIEGTLTAAKASREALQAPQPELSVLVSCNARRAVLKQRVDEEIEAVRDTLGDTTTLTGFYSYGEIGPPSPGAVSELHNETMTIISLAES